MHAAPATAGGGGDHSPAGPCCDSSLHCVVGGGRRGDTASMKPARGALSCFPFRMNVLLSSVSFNICGPYTHTSIYYKELAHAIQEAKSHHPQGKPGKLVVSLLNSSLSPTISETGAATVSVSGQGQEKTSVPAHHQAERASRLLSCLLSRAPAAACLGPPPPGG